MKKIALVCLLCLASTAVAQEQSQIDAARAYVETPVQQKLLEDMFSPAGIMAQMGLTGGRLSSEQQTIIAEIVSEELQALKPEIVDAMVNGMARNFSLEEIEALTAFYSSPVGASAMSKMNPFMQQTMAELGPSFQQMQSRLVPRIQAALKQ